MQLGMTDMTFWVIAICFVGVMGYCGYRFILYEKSLIRQIAEIQVTISNLQSKIKLFTECDVEWNKEGYNYLAIGNSVTVHNTTSYWYNEVGMAASDEEHDYFHIVLNYLKSIKHGAMGVPYNFSIWETLSHDRDETLQYLDHYLSPLLNLVTVQLGENAYDLTTYQEDFVALIEYIKTKAPQARVLIVDDFWSYYNRAEQKYEATNKVNAEFVSLDGIADNKDYFCGMGAVVYDSSKCAHIVNHSGVAKHPGDKGMSAIAARIIDVVTKREI